MSNITIYKRNWHNKNTAKTNPDEDVSSRETKKNIGRIDSAVILVRLLLFSSQKLYVACLVFLMNMFIRKPPVLLECWSQVVLFLQKNCIYMYINRESYIHCISHTYRVRLEKSQRSCLITAQIHDSIPIRGDSAPTRLAKSPSSPVQLAIQLDRYVNVTPIE